MSVPLTGCSPDLICLPGRDPASPLPESAYARRAGEKAVWHHQHPGDQGPGEERRGDQCLGTGLAAAERRGAARQDRGVQEAPGRRPEPGRHPGRGLRHRARGGQARAWPAAVRRAADGRHGAAPGQDRRDEDRRGQDPGGDAPRLPQRARRPRRPRGHRQRLPGAARLRLDGQDLQPARPERRLHRARAGGRGAARRLRRRRDLRHQQRVRLRLSARQHEVPARDDGAPAVQLRHRRRGRFDPDRRGANAADHLRPDRGQLQPLQDGRRADPEAGRPASSISRCCCARPSS